ncbi:hypothetical protein HDV06_001312 [Boothiomyces sp. JEL0866]|nr:hypothetical protein HDV06_001312 [Boothiomyces sp. JEL0866]
MANKMSVDSNPKFALYSDANCTGASTNVITIPTNVNDCTKIGLPTFMLEFSNELNTFHPPKSVQLFQGNMSLTWPDSVSISMPWCYTFSPDAVKSLVTSLSGISSVTSNDNYKGWVCNTGQVDKVPTFKETLAPAAKLNFYENNDCTGSSTKIGLSTNGTCTDNAFQSGLSGYANSTKSPFLSVKADMGSNLLLYTPEGQWGLTSNNECYTLPKDVLGDINGNVVSHSKLLTDSRFCAIPSYQVAASTTTTTAPTASSSVISGGVSNMPNLLIVLLLFFLSK